MNREQKKLGRPTDNPKTKPIHVRLDEETSLILEAYMTKHGVRKTEAIRRGIRLLKDTLR